MRDGDRQMLEPITCIFLKLLANFWTVVRFMLATPFLFNVSYCTGERLPWRVFHKEMHGSSLFFIRDTRLFQKCDSYM